MQLPPVSCLPSGDPVLLPGDYDRGAWGLYRLARNPLTFWLQLRGCDPRSQARRRGAARSARGRPSGRGLGSRSASGSSATGASRARANGGRT